MFGCADPASRDRAPSGGVHRRGGWIPPFRAVCASPRVDDGRRPRRVAAVADRGRAGQPPTAAPRRPGAPPRGSRRAPIRRLSSGPRPPRRDPFWPGLCERARRHGRRNTESQALPRSSSPDPTAGFSPSPRRTIPFGPRTVPARWGASAGARPPRVDSRRRRQQGQQRPALGALMKSRATADGSSSSTKACRARALAQETVIERFPANGGQGVVLGPLGGARSRTSPSMATHTVYWADALEGSIVAAPIDTAARRPDPRARARSPHGGSWRTTTRSSGSKSGANRCGPCPRREARHGRWCKTSREFGSFVVAGGYIVWVNEEAVANGFRVFRASTGAGASTETTSLTESADAAIAIASDGTRVFWMRDGTLAAAAPLIAGPSDAR